MWCFWDGKHVCLGEGYELVFIAVNKGAFDFLKNEGHDKTTSVVQYLIYKTVSGTGQTGGKGQDKK